jgi:hypothetical protein
MDYRTVYNDPGTGVAPVGAGAQREAPIPQKEKVDQWFFEPLKNMKGHDAFIAMAITLLLYEKYLRVRERLGDGKIFTQGAKTFRIMAEDFGPNPDECFKFWQDWRNGILHRAMPGVEHFEGYIMSGEFPRPLEVDGRRLKINPWRLRDVVLAKVEKDRALWKDPSNPLAKIVEMTEEA